MHILRNGASIRGDKINLIKLYFLFLSSFFMLFWSETMIYLINRLKKNNRMMNITFKNLNNQKYILRINMLKIMT